MPRPTSGTTIQRPDLASLASEYMEQQQLFIGLKAAPLFRVGEQSADYPVMPAEWAANLPNVDRSARGGYNRIEWEFETDTYACKERGIEHPVDDVEVKLYDRYFDAEAIAARRATATLLRRHEKRVLDAFQNTSTFSANDVTNEWDDATNATPYSDIVTGKENVEGNVGVEPDTLIIKWETLHDLGSVSEITDRIKYTYPGVRAGELSPRLLAEYFGLRQILVSRAAYNSSKEGQTASFTKMWDDEYAMLMKVVEAQDLEQPQVMRTFLWTEDSPSLAVTESYYSDETRSNIIRVRHYTDEEVIWTAAAYLLGNITS